MKNWQAAIRTWEQNDNKETGTGPLPTMKIFDLPDGKTCGDCGFFDRCNADKNSLICSIAINESKFWEKEE